MDNYYEILDVSDNSPKPIIEKSYKRLSKRLHLDKNSALNATQAFQVRLNSLKIATSFYKDSGGESCFKNIQTDHTRFLGVSTPGTALNSGTITKDTTFNMLIR